MSLQTTLLTSHKGVDLHAASALLVMKDRLDGGEHLVNLFRCEMHTFWGNPPGTGVSRLLDTGRYFNPNKHHFGVFSHDAEDQPWFDRADCGGQRLPQEWPGQPQDTDLKEEVSGPELFNLLLGGIPGPGHSAVDVVSYELDQAGPVLSGVLWRLVLTGEGPAMGEVGMNLAVARGRKQGLLINPHMEAWLQMGKD